MAITELGTPLDDPDLRATLFRCRSCGTSALYITGAASGESTRMLALVELKSHQRLGIEADIQIRGYKKGDPWPAKDIDKETVFYGLL